MAYRAIATYYFKKGLEDQGMKFIEAELFAHARAWGCQDIEWMQDEKDPSHWISTGVWSNLNDAIKFQNLINSQAPNLSKYCTVTPKREIYKIKHVAFERGRKVA